MSSKTNNLYKTQKKFPILEGGAALEKLGIRGIQDTRQFAFS